VEQTYLNHCSLIIVLPIMYRVCYCKNCIFGYNCPRWYNFSDFWTVSYNTYWTIIWW